MNNLTPKIKKEDLIKGAYYKGVCRNATVARWDGEKFHHWRTKFNIKFLETINCPEDDDIFDVFVTERKLDDSEIIEEIPYG
jgi:hypothetical protein